MATSNRTCFLFVLIMQTGFIRMNKFDTNIDLEAELWNLPQLHGHVKVRENAQMFWWFFNTTSDITSTTRKPLILWIQGGPGRASSGVGNFAEIGAFDQYLKERTENWLQDANVLFIDSPVGVGFSYVTGRSSLADSNEMIVSDLLVLIKTLLTDQLRDFQDVPLYLFGENYGAKVSAMFAEALHQEVLAGGIKCRLSGVGLLSPTIDLTPNLMNYGPYLHAMGQVDIDGKADIMRRMSSVKYYMNVQDYSNAFYSFKKSLRRLRGLDRNTYDPLHLAYRPTRHLSDFMNGPVQKYLAHISRYRWNDFNWDVFYSQSKSYMKPASKSVEYLLRQKNIKIAIFVGQLDFIANPVGTETWLYRLKWLGKKAFYDAPRRQISDPNNLHITIAGLKNYRNLYLYWVNGAGHMIPRDKPRAARLIMKDFLRIT